MLRLALVALTLAVAVRGDFTASRFNEIARAGLRDASSILRAFGKPSHAAVALGGNSCNGYQHSVIDRCSAWHDQLKGDSMNWTSFCTDPCWVEVSMANNTACLSQDIQNEIALLSVACETKGPQGSRCGTVISTISGEDPCSQYGRDSCTSVAHTPQCTWNDGCQRARTSAFLDEVCSPCLVDLMRAVATLTNLTGGEDISVSGTLVQSYQGLLCTQVNNQYCVIAVEGIMNNLTSGLDVSSATLGTACADNTATTCLRKVLPAAASAHLSDVINNAQNCARQFSSQSGDQFRSSVNQSCLPCYRGDVVDTNRILTFANNLCTKSTSGTYCVALANFHPSDAIQNCYSQAVAGTCSASCDSTFSTFFSTYGCCFGLLAQTVNKSALVTKDDITRFWAAVNSVRHGHNGNDGGASMAPMGSQNNNCGGGDDSPDLSKLAICPSQSDIATKMTTFCAYTRAATKIPKALHLQLNCTAVLASQTIYDAILAAIVQDIAQNLGLPKDAITGVLFQCPTDAPAAHNFAMLTASPATLQFVIQSDSASATTAAAASLDAALGNGTMTFPSLTSTVNSVCTTCATAANLANLATATALVPTPAPPPPTNAPGTSAASATSVVLSVAALIVAAVFSA